MPETDTVMVIDKEGRRGVVETASHQAEVFIQLENGQRVPVSIDMLVLQDDGSYYFPLPLADFQQERASASTDEVLVMPVLEEVLEVQKRQVESGGLRLTKVIHEREELVDELLLREELEVERVPINRPVEGPVPIRYVGNTMIVSLLEEVMVVEKRLMLKEELHISKRQVETRQPQPVTLRSEEVIIEPIDNSAQEEVVR